MAFIHESIQQLPRARIVSTDCQHSARLNASDELTKRPLKILERRVTIGMIVFHIRHHGNLRAKAQKHAIILDRLDYLITKNGFKTVLNFVHQLKELAYFNDHIIILSIDPGTLTENQLRQLEKECTEVHTKEPIKLPDDQLEILNYVQKQNFLGIKPSFSNIETELDMSKPTVRKRVGLLQASGYVQVNTHGRTKVVELTEKSRRLF